MKFIYPFLLFIFLFSSLSADFDQNHEILKRRILYLLKTGKEQIAFELYQDFYKETKYHDSELLHKIAYILIEKGFHADSLDEQVLALFGAGISLNEEMLPILKTALHSNEPKIQQIALHFLSSLHHDEADKALNHALNSNNLLIRLEALIYLAEQKSPKVVFHLDALMQKINPAVLPLFPQFFALIGTQDATKILLKLLSHQDEKVRVAAILSAANFKRDHLLPVIKRLSSQNNVLQQEACSFAFDKLKDDSSIEKLETFVLSSSPTVKIAALKALYTLGQTERRLEIEHLAKNGNLFAISLLASFESSESVLKSLMQHENLNVRLNATRALLKLKSSASVSGILEILIKDSKDLGFIEQYSPGGALKCLKAIPSLSQNSKDDEFLHAMTLKIKEEILEDAMHLNEKDFLQISKALFESNQNELIPLLVLILEELQTEDAISELKFYSQKAGNPLIRNYCNLSLFRLKEEGVYRENIEKFILQSYATDLIQFRPLLPFQERSLNTHFQLTPENTSRLLVDSFEAITRKQDEAGINLLLYAIQNGNKKNKYALAGLLMHATR